MAGAARDRSVVVRWWQTLSARLETAADQARSRELLASVSNTQEEFTSELGAYVRSSGLYTLGQQLHAYTTTSYWYRWLTAEPDPQFVVIDLRETYTLGWFITLLDTLFERFGPPLRAAYGRSVLPTFWTVLCQRPVRVGGALGIALTALSVVSEVWSGTLGESGLLAHAVVLIVGLLALRSTMTWHDLQTSRLGRLVAAICEPPEPSRQTPSPAGEPPAAREGDDELETGVDSGPENP